MGRSRLRHHRGFAALQSTSAKHPEGRTDRVLGRLDAVLIAARVRPETARVGIIPVATTTHTEPFHISKAIATLDYVSRGRAGFQARISPTGLEAAQFGRRSIGDPAPDGGQQVFGDSWTKRQSSSKSCVASGTAGKTTRRSVTSPPDALSTGTNSTTSTSKAHGSRSEVRPSHPVPRRVSPSSACWHTSIQPSGWPPDRPMWCSSPAIERGRPSFVEGIRGHKRRWQRRIHPCASSPISWSSSTKSRGGRWAKGAARRVRRPDLSL